MQIKAALVSLKKLKLDMDLPVRPIDSSNNANILSSELLSTDRGAATGHHNSRSVVKEIQFAKGDQSNNTMIVEPELEQLLQKKKNRLHFKQIHMNEEREVKTTDSVQAKKFP